MTGQAEQTPVEENRPHDDEQQLEYNPILDMVVPVVMLVTSAAYAWSLRDIVNFDLNLLFLKPLFIITWPILLFVFIREVFPAFGRLRAWSEQKKSRPKQIKGRFAPGTEGSALIVVLATLAFAITGIGNGNTAFVVSSLIYMTFVGYVLGLGNFGKIIFQAVALTAVVYGILGVLLHVNF